MIGLDKSEEELRNDGFKADKEIFGYPRWIVASVGLGLVLVLAVVGIVLKQRMDESARLAEESRKRMDEGGAQAWGSMKNEYETKIWQNGKRTYVVSYSFEANNQLYESTQEVVWDPKRNANLGVLVTYDPENPKINKLDGKAAATQITESQGGISNAWKETIKYTIYGLILVLLGGGYKYVSSRKSLPPAAG